jgi:glycosyltransferase involved in cell wall biosynthesis
MNVFLAGLAKAVCPGAPVIAWLHEPYKGEKKVYGAKAAVIYLVEFFQTLALRYTDVAVLFSRRALRLFRQRYPHFQGLQRMAPLPYRDEYVHSHQPRRYISFLGRADRAKGIDLFFALVDRLGQEPLAFEFQIVTASDIQRHLEALSPQGRQKLRVINKPHISDAELRQAAAESLAVMALYKETTQSGLIPVVLMQGTPLIGTDIEGITDWLRDGETGVIVPAEPTLEDIKGAIDYVMAHFPEMTGPCRAAYLANFDDGNWDRQYWWLPGLLQG